MTRSIYFDYNGTTRFVAARRRCTNGLQWLARRILQLCAALALISGCSKQEPVPIIAASTPRETLESLRKSFANNDSNASLACFSGITSKNKSFFLTVFQYYQAVFSFNKALDNIYGIGAWEQELAKEDQEPAPPRLPRWSARVAPLDKEWWSQLEIKDTKDKAIVPFPATGYDWELHLTPTGWRIEAASVAPNITDYKLAGASLNRQITVLKRVESKIKAERPKIEEITHLLFQELSASVPGK